MNQKLSPRVYTCVFVEVMDAHLQNNQTAEDDILASPDRLKGREHTKLPKLYTLHCYAHG